MIHQETLWHPVPNDLEAVKVLTVSPAVFDLYMWLSYRCFKSKTSEAIRSWRLWTREPTRMCRVQSTTPVPCDARPVAKDNSSNLAGLAGGRVCGMERAWSCGTPWPFRANPSARSAHDPAAVRDEVRFRSDRVSVLRALITVFPATSACHEGRL